MFGHFIFIDFRWDWRPRLVNEGQTIFRVCTFIFFDKNIFSLNKYSSLYKKPVFKKNFHGWQNSIHKSTSKNTLVSIFAKTMILNAIYSNIYIGNRVINYQN